ncbi:MAG: DNA-directed RNA polymerase subunit N [Candidatus Bathyarchaeia archaeon]
MMIPIRCFTCGKLLADKWEEYLNKIKNGENPAKALDDLGIKRYCCRRMLISHKEIIDDVLKYAEIFEKKKSKEVNTYE